MELVIIAYLFLTIAPFALGVFTLILGLKAGSSHPAQSQQLILFGTGCITFSVAGGFVSRWIRNRFVS